MKNLLLRILLPLLLFTGIAAEARASEYTLSGYVKDAATGEYLIGCNVFITPQMVGGSTNRYGFYTISLEEGEYTLVASFIGYKRFETKISLRKSQSLNIELQPDALVGKEFTVTATQSDINTEGTQVGTVDIPVERIKSLPAFMGEVDILKTIQLMPGVQSAGEGSSAFYVRGGGPDQNLILLDEAVVYNASHLFGFFSVFNADAIKNVELTKGGMPAQYGGRLSSVLDISMKDGNSRAYEADGGIGVISSRLTVQGPIKRDTSSFIISGRRTYIDILMQPFLKKDSPFKGTGYYFYDLNAKVNYIISEKDRVFVSGYFGRDVFSIKSSESDFQNSIDWGNSTMTLRWNHLFNDKLFSNTSLIYSDYHFSFDATQSDFDFKLYSGVNDYNAKYDLIYIPSPHHTVRAGVNYIYHIFTPNNLTARTGDTELDFGDEVKLYSHEAAAYANGEYTFSKRLRVNAGLRFSYFAHTGPFTRVVKDETGQVTDTLSFGKGNIVRDYFHVEPRVTLRLTTGEQSSLKASFTQNYQYIHLASIAAVSLPTDVWVPSSDLVEPQFGTQYSLGYYRNFKDNKFETSFEIYYKDLQNQIEFAEGALPESQADNNTDNNFVFGDGTSYGFEVFLQKREGNTTGWIGYTWSKTTRQFDDLNLGKPFPAKYDRRHDFSFILTHQFNPRWSAAMIWVYATGDASTLPVSRYVIEGQIISEYGERNSFRMPAYHRMDLSVTWINRQTDKFTSSFNLSVYNVYNRYNPYYIYYETSGNITDGSLEVSAKQVSLFPILPSIAWNFAF